MTPLHVVWPAQRKRLTIDELLDRLHPDRFEEIDAKVRLMRETYECPYTVRDYDGFKQALRDFYAHYFQTYYGAPFTMNDPMYERYFAYDFAQRNMKSYQGGDMAKAESNAIKGREGGFIAVVDALTEGIAKLHIEGHVQSVFLELIAPNDFDTRLRLIEELLKKYGPLLFPNDEIKPHYFWATQMEEFIKLFVAHLNPLRKLWRY